MQIRLATNSRLRLSKLLLGQTFCGAERGAELPVLASCLSIRSEPAIPPDLTLPI
jgi:hypothetical protein